MTYLKHYFTIILAHKWRILIFTTLCALITLGIGLYKGKHATYLSAVEIYPTFIIKQTLQKPWRLNPCHLTQRSLHSEYYQAEVINFAQSLPHADLSTRNYAKQIQWYETPEHTIMLQVTQRDSAAAAAILTYCTEELEAVFWHYTSTVFLERGGYRDIDIADRENVMDTLPQHYLEIYDQEGEQFLIYDVITPIHTEKVSFPTAQWVVVITMLALLLSCSFVILVHELKNAAV